MKERPILFSAPMVRALLGGTKTQTRRVVTPQPHHEPRFIDSGLVLRSRKGDQTTSIHSPLIATHCPYGMPGDRLYVREAWRTSPDANSIPPRDLHDSCAITYEADCEPIAGWGKYRPGMFMPRWASRITLEIVSVRVERLQDISDADAIAEGIERNPEYPTLWKRGDIHGDQNIMKSTGFPKLAYRSIWEQINGHESWSANPLVWVVEFKRVTQ
jgi:hypothetical protein